MPGPVRMSPQPAGCPPVGDGERSASDNILCARYRRLGGYLPVTERLGDFSMGLAAADINGDGFPDLIVSSGSDKSPQPLTVYYNQVAPPHRGALPSTKAIPPFPGWYSADYDHHMNLAVGDIDQDGYNDVAVAVNFDKLRRKLTGGVKLYMNVANRGQRELSSQPIWRNLDPQQRLGYSAMSVALGDA